MDLKLGKRPALIPAGLHDLTYYAAGPLPKAPASVAVPEVADWMLLGNGPDPSCTIAPNGVGDCGVASYEHVAMVDALITRHPGEREPDANQAVEYYLNYTGGQDTGVVLSQFLAYVRQHGYYGQTLHSYAPVKVHDVPTLQSAIFMYGAAYCGIVVTQAMMDATQAGRPWTQADTEGQILGGHAVPAVGYDDAGLTIVTWGQTQRITWPAWHAMSDEAWALLTGEFVARNGDGRGIALDALEADLNRLDPSPDLII